MRIISGKYKGRSISVPREVRFRPTTGKAKEALFSTLESLVAIEGLRVADFYAGSGAFGFEALSRGALFTLFVENNGNLADSIKKNARQLQLVSDEYLVIKSSFERGSEIIKQKPISVTFDVIFCDPPYEMHPGDELIKRILSAGLVHSGSIIIIESSTDLVMGAKFSISKVEARLIKKKSYGQTILRYYECLLSPD
ncbi:MAG: 16S rRNA (guanine(966)-N(2))-methyltransferase RsmD [Deltaproteobacteria bacterium]|nr:16S rRNA (guanine(966)-N(2))-methyltransferase RsmD [Deltaproteobacteria bacterium]